MKPILEVVQLKKKYGTFEALKGISFSTGEGEIIGILGPSGCGKSTLLQLIAGLSLPSGGVIRIHGKTIVGNGRVTPPEKRGVNMVFQDYSLWPHMTIYDNIAYGLRRHRVSRIQRTETVTKLIHLLQLDGLQHRYPPQLSGGQQQRVAIARALATHPDLLLMDEPLSNLDKQLRIWMRSEMAFLFRRLGQSVVYVTHDPEEAFALSDRLLIIRDGRVEQFDSPARCFAKPISRWAASLIGATNRLRGTIVGQDGQKATIRIGNRQFTGISFAAEKIIGQADVMFRPEAVTVVSPSIPDRNVMAVRTLLCMFEGAHYRLLAETEQKQRVNFLTFRPIAEHTTVMISIKIEDTFVYATNE